jgi:uncharacterized membrane protein YidH (DUF202 family)
MGEKTKTTSNRNMHAIILAVIGFIALIAGVAVATVKGTHLRGSGLGTILIVVGVVLFVIAALRFYYKST